jgi:hypothetical protein
MISFAPQSLDSWILLFIQNKHELRVDIFCKLQMQAWFLTAAVDNSTLSGDIRN